MTDETKDELAATIAQIDQMTMFIPQLVRLIAAYAKELAEQGVPTEVAAALLVEFQRHLIRGSE